MKVKYLRSYRNAKGTLVFVYTVAGNEKALAQFAEAQGEFHVEDEETGMPLWFTTRFIGKSGELIITSKGKVVADMSEFDQVRSLVEQNGGNFGDVLAGKLIDQLVGGNPPPQQIAPNTIDAPHEDVTSKPQDLDGV